MFPHWLSFALLLLAVLMIHIASDQLLQVSCAVLLFLQPLDYVRIIFAMKRKLDLYQIGFLIIRIISSLIKFLYVVLLLSKLIITKLSTKSKVNLHGISRTKYNSFMILQAPFYYCDKCKKTKARKQTGTQRFTVNLSPLRFKSPLHWVCSIQKNR